MSATNSTSWTVYSVEPQGDKYQVVSTLWNPTPDEKTRRLVLDNLTKVQAETEAAYLQASYDKLRDVFARA